MFWRSSKILILTSIKFIYYRNIQILTSLGKIMKLLGKTIFVGISILFTTCGIAQEEKHGLNSEVSFGIGYGSEMNFDFATKVQTDTTVLPGQDSLDKMNYAKMGRFNAHTVNLSYTRWLNKTNEDSKLRNGVRFQVDYFNQMNMREDWNSTTKWTIDTLVSQQTGDKYPIDSTEFTSYSAKTNAGGLRFDLGYRLLFETDSRWSFVTGLDVGYGFFINKTVTYNYTQTATIHNTYNPDYVMQFRNMTGYEERIIDSDTKSSLVRVAVPFEVRLSTKHDETDDPGIAQNTKASFGVVPAYYSVNYDGNQNSGFTVSFVLSAIVCF